MKVSVDALLLYVWSSAATLFDHDSSVIIVLGSFNAVRSQRTVQCHPEPVEKTPSTELLQRMFHHVFYFASTW